MIRLGDVLDYSLEEEKYDMVVTNIAPYGMDPDNKPLDSWTSMSSRHFNYLYRCMTLLKDYGRAAVVIPDHVLFIGDQRGGAIARRQLLESCEVHTLLRLPLEIFRGIGAKASVIFFDKKPIDGRPGTKRLWVYDMRSSLESENRIGQISDDFKDFIRCYNTLDKGARMESQNFWSLTREQLIERDDVNLDLAR